MGEAMDFENEEKKKPLRPFGPKSTKEAQLARIQRLYKRQLEGLPVRQLVMEHAVKEQKKLVRKSLSKSAFWIAKTSHFLHRMWSPL